MVNNGKCISWQHLEDLYLKDTRVGTRLVSKLKYEHANLTSFSKLRVNLAAQVSVYEFCIPLIITQVMSTVLKTLKFSCNPEVSETASLL